MRKFLFCTGICFFSGIQFANAEGDSDESRKKVDVVFVIDNSASMSGEQHLLAVHSKNITTKLISKYHHFDWQISLVSSDNYENRKRDWPTFSQKDNNVVRSVSKAIKKMGTEGMGFEKAVLSSQYFFHDMKILRKDAKVILIFLSDEDEGRSTNYVDFFADIENMTGKVSEISTLAVVNPKNMLHWRELVKVSPGPSSTYDIYNNNLGIELEEMVEGILENY